MCTDHSLNSPCAPQEIANWPSLLRLSGAWPWRLLRHCPVLTSHTLIVASSEPDASRFPSGEKATERASRA